MDRHANARRFPLLGGVMLGLGIGGFFDGIVFHQLLQWHHMVSSAGYPPNTVPNLEVNTFYDGLFHAATYAFLAIGLAIFWRHARHEHATWSGKLLGGTLLIGWGIFNVVEGLVNHQLLGLHHVNETVPHSQWLAWDLGFLAWGAAMIVAGVYLLRRGRVEIEARTSERGAPYVARTS
jgi:uncharacterized membrane protein